MAVLHTAFYKWDKLPLVSGGKAQKWMYSFCKLHLRYYSVSNAGQEVLTILQTYSAVLSLLV